MKMTAEEALRRLRAIAIAMDVLKSDLAMIEAVGTVEDEIERLKADVALLRGERSKLTVTVRQAAAHLRGIGGGEDLVPMAEETARLYHYWQREHQDLQREHQDLRRELVRLKDLTVPVKCSERLPERGQECSAYNPTAKTWTEIRGGEAFQEAVDIGVYTCWLPRPEPPEAP